MTYKVAILEDDEFQYQTLQNKVLKHPNLLSFVDGLKPTSINISMKSYLEQISQNQADIYFVDWQLEFLGGRKNVEDVFNELIKHKEFNFFNKFWVFYSGKSHEVNDFVHLTFPRKPSCYYVIGKTNISESWDRDYFMETIEMGVAYIDNIKAPWASSLPTDRLMVKISQFNGTIKDIEFGSNTPNLKEIKLAFDRFVCFLFNKRRGLLIAVDDSTNGFKFYRFTLSSTSKGVTDLFKKFNLIDLDGFMGNPAFFNKSGYILDKYEDSIHKKSGIINTLKTFEKSFSTSMKWVVHIMDKAKEHGIY